MHGFLLPLLRSIQTYQSKNLKFKVEELANDRIDAIGRADLEAKAGESSSLREEADRLLAEHRDRMAELQEAMEVRLFSCDSDQLRLMTPSQTQNLVVDGASWNSSVRSSSM